MDKERWKDFVNVILVFRECMSGETANVYIVLFCPWSSPKHEQISMQTMDGSWSSEPLFIELDLSYLLQCGIQCSGRIKLKTVSFSKLNL